MGVNTFKVQLEDGTTKLASIEISNSIRPVKVLITRTTVGNGLVVTHPFEDGHKYIVPLYKMTVSGKDNNKKSISEDFKVIRFGVQWKDNGTKAKVVGLASSQSHKLKWVDYMGGSWQVHKNWLIHKGADNPQVSAWGAIGCVEVCGVGGWKKFNNLIVKLSGSNSYTEIGQSGKLVATYESTNRPPLKKK